MLQKFLACLFSLLIIVLPLPVYAESMTPMPTEMVMTTPMVTMGEEEHNSKGFKLGKEIRNTLEDHPMIASHGAIRDYVKNLFEQRKTEVEQERTMLQQKIQTFKDEKKKELILRIDDKVASVSSRRTTKMSEAVTKLQTILDTIKQKESDLKNQGCDVTAVDTAIAAATTALANATAAINVQAQKTYALNVTDETTAKLHVGQTVSQLQMDLMNTFKTVIIAKQAVLKSAVALRMARVACMKLSGTPMPSMEPTNTQTETLTVMPTNTVMPTMTVVPTQ